MSIYQGSKLMSGGGGGPSPYEIAKQNGYTGTESEFNQLLAALDQNATKEETNTLLQNKPDKNSVVNPNLLDNWYFGNPVDQRQGRVVKPNTTYYSDNTLATAAGTTNAYVTAYRYATGTASGVNYASFKLEDSNTAPTYYTAPENVVRGYTGAGYGIDRWYGEDILIESNGLTLTAQGKYIFQNLDDELKKALAGKTVTVSALLSTGELLFGAKVYAAAPSANEYFVVGTIHIVNTIGRIMFWASQKATIVAVKLELGTQQTLAHQDENGNWVLNEIPDYGEQLARCQRYALDLNFNNIAYQTVAIGVGWSGGTEVDFVIPTPVTMRANPVVINPANFKCVDTTDISWHSFTRMDWYVGSGFVKLVGFIDASVAGRPYALMCDAINTRMILSSDL